MPEPLNKDNEDGKEEETKVEEPKVDAFGMGEPEAPKKEEVKTEAKDDKKSEPLPDDHPTVVALKAEIEKVKSEYGGNLSGQRQVIERLTKEIDDLKKGNKTEDDKEDLLFPDIKWSKDLTPEEREAMTDNEIKQMDEIAQMKDIQNKQHIASQKGKKDEEAKKADDIQSLVKSTALELSKDEDGKENVELANQIIESAKQFNLVGLDEKTIKERVATAQKLLPDYTPPKEKETKSGKTVKKTTTTEDPFGIDAIVEGASKSQDAGNYDL